jgi:hypothetical protein
LRAGTIETHVHDIASAEHVIELSDHHPGDLPQPSDPLHLAAHVVLQGLAIPAEPAVIATAPALAVVWTMAGPAAVDLSRRYRSCAPTGLTVRAASSQREPVSSKGIIMNGVKRRLARCAMVGMTVVLWGAALGRTAYAQEAPPFPLLKQSEGHLVQPLSPPMSRRRRDSPNKRAHGPIRA